MAEGVVSKADLSTGVLELRVLGPVELRHGGHTLPIAGPRQRALLAALALQANEVVSSDRLIQALFGADASPAAANAVQAAVSRLRRVLPSGVLETRHPGYVLHLSADELDATRFELAAREGRRRLEGGDFVDAAARLRDALALWRGEALADVDQRGFAELEIRRLEELRLAAEMDCVDADLALGRSSELLPELERLAVHFPMQERLQGQLMLALYRCGRQVDALAAYRAHRDRLREDLGLEPSRALQELERAMLQHDPALDPEPVAARAASSGRDSGIVACPFKGLASFATGDSEVFFGRERIVDELIARLAAGTFVGIVGASGAGKSSLLQAGVLAALRRGALPGSDGWTQMLIRPSQSAGFEPPEVPEGKRVVVAVDQLEELFAARDDVASATAFLDALSACAFDVRRRYLVLVALRADFYGRCAAYPDFAGALSRSHLLLGAMKRDELFRAIEQPAERAGLSVDRELIERLIDDVAGEPGALPLLSATLVELWREREGTRLGLSAYRRSGGVRGAVARLAEDAYAQLDGAEQHAARLVLLRLVRESDGVPVRRRVLLDELELDREPVFARAVLAFTEARLLTISEGALEISHEALLSEWPRLVAWLDEDRLGRQVREHLAESARQWDEHGRHPGDLYRGPRLVTALELLDDNRVVPNAVERDFLDAGRREQERESALQRKRVRRLRILLAGVAGLLAVAIAAGAFALAQRQLARRQATEALAGQLGAEAVSQPRLDLAMLLARESLNMDRTPQTEGTLLATLLRNAALIGTFTLPIEDRPLDVKVSPDGSTIAVVTNNNIMRFFDTHTHRQIAAVPLSAFGYTFDPATGDLFAGAPGANPAMLLVDPRTGRTVRSFTFSTLWQTTRSSPLEPVVVTGSGRYGVVLWAAVNSDGSLGAAYMERWSLARGGPSHLVSLGRAGMIAATALGGDRIAVATNGHIDTYDVATGARLISASGPSPGGAYQAGATISPDGRTFAYALADGTVHFRNIASGRTVAGSTSHTGFVDSLEFSHNSALAASTGDDGQVIVWNPRNGQAIEHLVGHFAKVNDSDFSPDDSTLYAEGLDGTVMAWDLGNTRRFGDPFRVGAPIPLPSSLGPRSLVVPLAVSASGTTFAADAAPSTAGVFSTSTLRRVASVPLGPNQEIGALAFAGDQLVVGGDHGLVQLWNVSGAPRLAGLFHGLHGTIRGLATGRDGHLVAAVDGSNGPPPAGGGPLHEEGALALWRDGRLVGGHATSLHTFGDGVAISSDGTLAAVAADDGRVILIDTHTGRTVRTIRPATGAIAVAFAPDGTLASGAWSGIVSLWDPRTGTQIGHRALVDAAPVASLAFAPDGRTLAIAGGSSGHTRLWMTSTMQQLGSDLPGGAGQWGSAAYTPDGRDLLTVYGDGSADRWPVTVNAWEQHACAVAGRGFTREEWSRFVSGRPYEAVCR